MAGKVEKELSEATGVKPKAKEKRQDFLKRLLGGVSDLDDGPFKDLSTAAQKWNNTAAKLFDTDDELPEPDGDAAEAEKPAKGKAKPAPAEDEDADSDNAGDDDETNADDDADAADEGETEDTTVKTSKKPAAKKAEAKKTPAKPAKADKATTKKKAPVERVGVIDALKDVLKEGKPLTVAQIHAKLLKKFPDRGDAMINTIRTQLSVLPGKGFAIKKVKTDDGVTYKAGK